MLSISLTTFAMDTTYINDTSKWRKNENVNTVALDSLSGYYQYLFDKNENTIYFHISYSLEDLNNNDEISIYFTSSNKSNSYKILFDKDKVNYLTESSKKPFNILSSFKTVAGSGQEILFGIEFLNKEDKKLLNDISISLNVNSKAYKIANNMILEFNDVDDNLNSTTRKDKTTTNKSSTTKPSKENNSSNVTTKFYYNGQINNNQSNNAEFNNKYLEGNNQGSNNKYNYDSNNNYTNDDGNEGSTNFIDRFNNNGQVVIPEKETKSTLSPISKILITSSVILCALGIVLIVNYIIKLKKEKHETKKEESNE